MNLEDVIKEMPEKSVGVQWLSKCASGFKSKKRPSEHCEVSFVTDAINPSYAFGKSDKVCAIIWLDKKEFKAAMERLGG